MFVDTYTQEITVASFTGHLKEILSHWECDLVVHVLLGSCGSRCDCQPHMYENCEKRGSKGVCMRQIEQCHLPLLPQSSVQKGGIVFLEAYGIGM